MRLAIPFHAMVARAFPAVPLRAYARSRGNPVKRRLVPLSRWQLHLDERLAWRFARYLRPRAGNSAQMIAAIHVAWAGLQTIPDDAFDAELTASRPRAADVLRPDRGAAGIAHVLEVMRRHLGFCLRDNQIACAVALLSGECVEMRTGEGKTLAAGLAALIAARVGVSSHVITVNDYLAGRDFELIRPMAERLGLSIAVLASDMEDPEKTKAYDSDIVYGTNKTFVFDHLRDRREARKVKDATPRQMGQALAIVDEADSVLIDDATVPMILSEQSPHLPAADLALFHALDGWTKGLESGRDRDKDAAGSWRLTRRGVGLLIEAAKDWHHPMAQDEDLLSMAEQALAARFGFLKGEAYIVQGGAVVLIDQATGRLMPDRRWGYGMHQLVEIKEGLAPTPETRTVGQITQQSYFRQYRLLSGLTGTARECRSEFWAIYRLPVRPIKAHAPSGLRDLGLRILPTADEKWQAVVARAVDMAKTRAVLIGLNDVVEAEILATAFAKAGRDVAVLDALAEDQEAELVAKAGQIGRITIATHLAGRGTDIALLGGLRAAGGLHVIISSVMASGRLERQLYGRAGRQGDPGSYERIISLQDRGLIDGAMGPWRRVMRLWLGLGIAPGFSHRFALAQSQAARDRRARMMRKAALLREQDLARQLGYV